MIKSIPFFLAVVLLAGCVSVSPEGEVLSTKRKSFVETHRVRTGMSLSEVRAILGDKLIIGYRQKDSNLAQFEPITVPQPYRQEQFSKDGRTYVTLYYNTFIVKPDGMIAEDELTPLVFENGILLTKGFDELDLLKRQ